MAVENVGCILWICWEKSREKARWLFLLTVDNIGEIHNQINQMNFDKGDKGGDTVFTSIITDDKWLHSMADQVYLIWQIKRKIIQTECESNLTFYTVSLSSRVDQGCVRVQIYRVNLVIRLTFSSYQNSRCLKLSWTSNDSLKDNMSQNY